MGEIAPFRGQGRQISGLGPPICLRSGRFIEISVPGTLICPIPLAPRRPPRPAFFAIPRTQANCREPSRSRRNSLAIQPFDPKARGGGGWAPAACRLSVAANKRPWDAYLCRIVGVATNKRLGAA